MTYAELSRLADEIVSNAQAGREKLAAAVEHIEALDLRDSELLAQVDEAKERMKLGRES